MQNGCVGEYINPTEGESCQQMAQKRSIWRPFLQVRLLEKIVNLRTKTRKVFYYLHITEWRAQSPST